MVNKTVCVSAPHRTPPRSDGLVNHVRRADSAVCEGLICTSDLNMSNNMRIGHLETYETDLPQLYGV
jgi:hypothetical protein